MVQDFKVGSVKLRGLEGVTRGARWTSTHHVSPARSPALPVLISLALSFWRQARTAHWCRDSPHLLNIAPVACRILGWGKVGMKAEE